MSEKRDIFLNTVSQVLVRFVTLIFTLVSVKLITNFLGPAGTGEYNTITTYINFFIVIADLGLFSVTVREIAKNPQDEKRIISNVFYLRFITALIAAVSSVLIVYFTDYDPHIKLGTLVASVYVLFNLMSSVYDMVLQTRLKMQFSALAEFISKLVSIAALFVIIRLSGDFLLIVATIPLYAVVIFLIKWYFSGKFIKFSPAYNAKVSKWVFNMAWPMGIVFILNNLYFKIDTLILFIVKGAVEVGIYTVAYKVLEVSVFIGSYFASSLKPVISRNIGNKEFMANLISKSFLIMLILSVPVSLISALFPREIINFLSNESFTAGAPALILLGSTLPLIYLDTLLGEILVANDERRLLMKVAAFILSFNLILNLILIPRYSFMGAATVTLLSELLLLIINLHFTKKIIPYKIDFGKVFLILLSSGAAYFIGIALKSLEINFIILILLSLLIQALLFAVFGIIKISTLKEVLRSN